MRIFFSLMAAVLVLTGCAGGREDTLAAAERVQQRFAAAQSLYAEAEVTVLRPEETLRYTLAVRAEGDERRVSVLSPQLLAGVTAVLTDDALRIEYDGTVLDGAASEGVNAASCVPMFWQAAAKGSVSEHGREQDALRVTFLPEGGDGTLLLTGWFAGDGAPLRAEIEENGVLCAQMEFTDFDFGDIIVPDGEEPPN